MRNAVVLMVMVAVITAASARQLCLHGESPLAVGPSAPERPWCSGDDCTLRWSLALDTATVDTQRWRLNATLNGTSLDDVAIGLSDVRVQCSTSGEVIVTSAAGANGERLRIIWTYSGASSVSCGYVLTTVDLAADFRNFQALLAYSGHISSFDATFSSQASEYSIAAGERPCPVPPVVEVGSSSSSSGSSTSSHDEECSVGACRHSVDVWRVLKDEPAWHSVDQLRFCSLSCRDIILKKGQASKMPVNWLDEAALLCTAELNAALYGCELPVDDNEWLAASLEHISNPLKCSLNAKRVDVVAGLHAWNDRDDACSFEVPGAEQDPVQTEDLSGRERSFLIWAIVMTAAFVVAIVLLCVVLVYFREPLQRSCMLWTAGRAAAVGRPPNDVAACRVNGEVEMTSFWSGFLGSGDDALEEDDGAPVPFVVERRTQPTGRFVSDMAAHQFVPQSCAAQPTAPLAEPAPTYSSPYNSYAPSQYYMSAMGEAPGASHVIRNVELSSYASGDPTARNRQ